MSVPVKQPRETALRWSRWRGAFLVACILPIVALFVKPADYSFYMFQSAVPPTSIGKARLLAANALLVVAACTAVAAAFALAVSAVRRRRLLGLLAPPVVVFHPLLQPVFFEAMDTEMNYAWYRRTQEIGVFGRTEAEVRSLLGEPARIESNLPGGSLWEYDPLPIYWLGSSGQIVFQGGRVTYVEPNDD